MPREMEESIWFWRKGAKGGRKLDSVVYSSRAHEHMSALLKANPKFKWGKDIWAERTDKTRINPKRRLEVVK